MKFGNEEENRNRIVIIMIAREGHSNTKHD